VRLMLADERIHIGIVWIQLMDAYVDVLIDIFREIQATVTKPFVVCWVAAPDAALKALREAGIAVLRGAEPAVDACAALVRYAQARRDWEADAAARKAMDLPQLKWPAAGGVVGSLEARALMESSGVTVAPARLAKSADEAVAAARELGYPVVVKVESRDLPHKTEAGGVKLGLKDEAAVRWAYAAVTDGARRYKAEATIDGVLVQPMVEGDVELVVGLQNDPVFGVVVMVGLGGIHIEVLKDVAFRQAPVTEAEAGRMLGELKSRAILDGVRGRAGVDRAALARLVSAVSRLGAAAGGRLQELDLNPVLAGPRGVTAVDWLMVIDEAGVAR
jgi:acetate---CoA ligase (ADP-forming)